MEEGYIRVPINDDQLNDESIYVAFHGLLMWTAWGILGFIQLATNRYLKMYWKINMWIHRIAGSLIWLITLSIGLLAISGSGWVIEDSLHNKIGFFITTVVTLIVLGGVFTRSMMNRLKWRTHIILNIKKGHRVRITFQY